MDNPVLLSICIPTFNRSEYLRVMLEALLPQVAEVGSRVEVWVSDNASTDDTPKVVEQASRLGPVTYSRNDSNLGPLGNIIKPATQLATGEYVWLVGDHNLFMPGALSEVVGKLEANKELDVFYINFRCADYPTQWPKEAFGGHEGAYNYVANPNLEDRKVPEWRDLVRGGTSALCTQVYAHVIRRQVWLEYWRDRRLKKEYTSPETTYPHTWMLTQQRFLAPAYYVGTPAITIFNGAQSWSNADLRGRVVFRGLPGLIDQFRMRGLHPSQLGEARSFAARLAYETSVSLFAKHERLSLIRVLDMLGPAGLFHHRYLVAAIWQAFIDTRDGVIIEKFEHALATARAFKKYVLYESRPARVARGWRRP
jgi:glycosyltransferase involved in cell wall biosynthesis